MKLTPVSIALVFFVAAPAPYSADVELNLVARGGGSKGKGGASSQKSSLAQRLPPRLRNQYGRGVRDARNGDRELAQTAASKAAFQKAIQPLKSSDPVPNNWEQGAHFDIDSKNRGRGLHGDLLEERDLADLVEGLIARGRGKTRKVKGSASSRRPSLAQRVRNLPPELRNQIGDHLRDIRKTDREQQQTAANMAAFSQAIQPLRDGNPVTAPGPWPWDHDHALEVYYNNRG